MDCEHYKNSLSGRLPLSQIFLGVFIRFLNKELILEKYRKEYRNKTTNGEYSELLVTIDNICSNLFVILLDKIIQFNN